jgi:putative toxin-antitoxin system antitoxin component (TIGR02293 family)
MASSAAALVVPDPAAAATPDLERLRQFARLGAPGAHAYVVLLGMNAFEPRDLLRALNKGLPYRAFDRFCKNTGLPFDVVTALVDIPRRTMTRRKAEGRFLPSESDRLLRASRLFAQALELFEGDRDAALAWLMAEQPALGRATPLDLARTEVGSREIERLMTRLEHGVFS